MPAPTVKPLRLSLMTCVLVHGDPGSYRGNRRGKTATDKIFSVAHVHPSAASFGVEEPVVRGVADAAGERGKP